jgi:hypothetical protein
MTAGVSFSSVFTGKIQAQRRKKKQGSQFTPASSACGSINSKNDRLLQYARLSQIDPASWFSVYCCCDPSTNQRILQVSKFLLLLLLLSSAVVV